MKPLKIVLQLLRESQYLTAHCLDGNNKQAIVNAFLKNGQKFQRQLLQQWRNTNTDWAQSRIQETKLDFEYNKGRLSFLRSREFQKNCQQLFQSHVANFKPIVCKTIGNSPTKDKHGRGIFLLNNQRDDEILLISDYFVPSSNVLEKFYNIQRERKIWWMRYSANPSRYFVEPFDLHSEHDIEEEYCKKCQSITIKSHLEYDSNDMESITLVPLNELNNNKSNPTQISLVRSVINLVSTTCAGYDLLYLPIPIAMILDGSQHNKEKALMLNRKLAPYQVILACIHAESKFSDMHELSVHLEYLLRRAGLRLYDTAMYTNSQKQLQNELINADSLGIPYAILLDENSLRTGLMKLRNRDTALSETIHISDLPNYLLNIFTH